MHRLQLKGDKMEEKEFELVKSRCIYCGHYDFARVFHDKDYKLMVCCVACCHHRSFRVDICEKP